MDKMTIIRFYEIGGPEVLQFDEIDIPQPLQDEVLFKVDAFALNQADILFINGYHYTQPIFPSRIGSEATGTVIAIGDQVSTFKIGDNVSAIPFYTQKYGVQGEYATVPESFLSITPEDYNTHEATAFWMQYLTAYYALFKLGNVKKNDWVFIPATSSTAGQGALSLAKEAGAKVIGSTRSQLKKKFIKSIGADEVIVTDEEDTLQRLKQISGKQGIQFVFDPIGGTSFNAQYMPALSFGGSAAIYGLLSGEETLFPIIDLVRNNSKIYGYSMFNHVMDMNELEEGKSYIINKITTNNLRPIIDQVFPFDKSVEAYMYMLSNQQKGKIIVEI